MLIPEAVVPLFLRATRSNAPFLSQDETDKALRRTPCGAGR